MSPTLNDSSASDPATFVDANFCALAIESATAEFSIGLCRDGQVECQTIATVGAQSRSVFSVIKNLLAARQLSLTGLDCVAFDCGPGGFTGLRVGASVAQSLAFGAGLPVVKVSSLATLAQAALRDSKHQHALSCLDARMGQVYFAGYQRDEARGVALTGEERLIAPAELAAVAADQAVLAGPGWAAYPELRETFSTVALSVNERAPSAQALLELAVLQYRAGETVSPEQAVPNYIRNQVASRSAKSRSPVSPAAKS